MHGNNKFICIAGKNQCAIDFLKYTSLKIEKKWILVLPNKSDNGKSGWQPSFKEYAKRNKFTITSLKKMGVLNFNDINDSIYEYKYGDTKFMLLNSNLFPHYPQQKQYFSV